MNHSEFSVQGWAGCILFLVCTCLCLCCSDYNSNGDPLLVYASDADFADSTSVAVELTPGFQLKLWAPGPLLANAVAISFDNQGAAYISETQRRKSSDLDIRSHRDWMVDDLSLQSLDDTRELHMNKLDPKYSAENQWMEDFNQDGSHDWRDLTVQSEYIRKIWDSDGDGRADISALFAEGINEMLTGVAAGVLHYDDDVYLTAAPDLYKFTDKDGDGDADERSILSHGYGIHIAYAGHDMSGLTIGPDGKVYWSVGDIGVNVKNKEGREFFYPNQGAVMRCNPDGSDFEVFAHGLRNPQELAFDAYGNLISVDNDGDHPGEHERFVHILEGSDSGWRINWQFGKYTRPNESYKVWMDEKLHLPHFRGQAAYILPPLALAPDGPAGLVYQPGTALNSNWENYFFGSYFKGSAAKSKIQAFRLEPKGASFSVAETKDILSGIVSTGLAFGPDGALYLNDWLEGYEKKPAGRIWQLDVPNRDQQRREHTSEILARGMEGNSLEELQRLLEDPDMRVRMEAQFELVKRNKPDAFLKVLDQTNHELAQIHAIWGFGQIIRSRNELGEKLLPYLASDNPEIKAQTAKVLGDARVKEAAELLLDLLDDQSARVKYFAAEALGKLAYGPAFEPLTRLIIATGDSDPHLRHGLIYALYQLGNEEELVALSQHPSPDLRIGAVVALREMNSPGLNEFLNDSDTLVLVETARAIHDDLSVPEALPALAASLLQINTNNQAFVRRAINANLRLGDAASAERLAEYAAKNEAPVDMRSDALWALGYWQEPPVLDRVDGRYRKLPGGDLNQAQLAFSKVANQLLGSGIISLRTSAVVAVGRLKYQQEEERLIGFSLQTNEPPEVRRAALQSLAELESKSIEGVLNSLLVDKNVDLRTDAQSLLGVLGLPPETVVGLLTRVLNNSTIAERQQALTSLGKIDHPAAVKLLDEWLAALISGNLEPAVQLDLIMAVSNGSSAELKSKLDSFEQNRADATALDRYQETLFGGDSQRGRRLFFQDNSAQCVRCHLLGEFGGEVGPDLNGIASVLGREDLLEAMIDPSARLAPGYGTVSVTLKDGEQLVGVLDMETADSLSVRTADGANRVLGQDQLQNKNYIPSSMPSMQSTLTKEEVRDLVAFLVEQREQ